MTQVLLSQNRLAIHLGKATTWVRAQGQIVVWRGETWEQVLNDNGGLKGYRLVSKETVSCD